MLVWRFGNRHYIKLFSVVKKNYVFVSWYGGLETAITVETANTLHGCEIGSSG